ncbi:beta-galactosidase [Nonomuraea jiangxiensis]|uniref:beta-galactosidase n=1 Tax=Nonomuraea jiangxiensis TaxID=633440 RepID=A0A1G9MHK7_9ACTN|nr:beta-galactosidase [Nonomuraea jiangxiensis]SDL73491.1 beta-galactosidase/beta-galactosidase [Nonomuraea jiangxiensis]
MTIIGAQYYRPPNPPREDWDRDLGRMRAAGLDTVKFWACWSWMNPAPGGFDFADLDELMDLAARHDLGVVVNTILENAPYWLEHRLPQARYLDHEDRPVRLVAAMNTPGGGWPGLCFDNEEVWAAAEDFLRALADRYRGHPALRVWDVWNEPHLEPASYHPGRVYCYCPASLDRFHKWLRDRYATLGELNTAWSRRYSSWDEVAPPRQFESVPDMIDWREHWFANLAGWLDRRCAIVRGADPGTPVMTHVALSGFTGQLATHTLDEFDLTGPVDLFGTSSFPTWLMGDDPVEHLFNLDAARGAAGGKPFWQAELQGGRGRRDGYRGTAHPRADTVALWMWNAVASGASGVVFWQWRPELLGPESPGYGLCAPDGELTDRVRAVSDFAAVVADWGEVVPEPGRTGLLVSRRSALHAFATDRGMDLYRDAVMGAYRLLADADEPVEVLHDLRLEAEGVPEHIEAILWPMPATASTGLAAALDAFVRRGGILVSEAAPGEYAPGGARRPRVPGAGLDTLFGVRQIDADLAADDLSVHLEDGTILPACWQRDLLRLEGAEAVAYFTDGSPAVTRNRTGDGQAIVVGTYPSLAYAGHGAPSLRSALSSLLGMLQRRRTLTWHTPGPGLYSRPVTVGGRRAVIAINWTEKDQEAGCAHDTINVPARSGRLHLL